MGLRSRNGLGRASGRATHGLGSPLTVRTNPPPKPQVEILSKQNLEEFMQKNIFSKLDMHDTTFRPELVDEYLPRKMESATRDPKTGGLLAGAGRHPLPIPVQDYLGGLGLYSTPKDLVKVLKEVLAGGGTIIKRESVTEILNGQLNDETRAAFMQVIDGRSKSHLRQTWPAGFEGTFGLSSSINFDDFPGRRAKHSMNWAGASGLQAVSNSDLVRSLSLSLPPTSWPSLHSHRKHTFGTILSLPSQIDC